MQSRNLSLLAALSLLAIAPVTAQSGRGGAPAPTAPAQDKAPVPIDEWKVPFDQSRPRDPAVAPDGRIWFVGQVGNYVAVFDPKTREFKKYDLENGANPHSNIVAADGMVWYSGNTNASIGRLDPKTGEIKVIRLPAEVRDPHTMIFDGKGGMWFTVQNANYVGYLTLATENVKMIKMPDRTRPYGIVIDNTGRPYFDLFGTNQIGTIDPATMELKTYALPDPGARPRRIARTTDGAIWYTDYSRGFTGKLDPKTGKVEEWENPSGKASLPYAMAVDDADRVWYVETGVQPNRMIGFDTKTKQIISNTAITGGTGRNTVRHMVFDPKTRTIWYGSDNNFIGMVKVPPKPAM